jgi:hypothetical protein
MILCFYPERSFFLKSRSVARDRYRLMRCAGWERFANQALRAIYIFYIRN